MDEEQFKEFTEEVIPQQLFHIDPKDIDDATGARLDEVILVGLINVNISCLKHKPLQWFLDTFLIKNDMGQNNLTEEQEREFEELLQIELEQQLLAGEMIGSDDFFPSSEEELFMQIQEDEREEWDKK